MPSSLWECLVYMRFFSSKIETPRIEICLNMSLCQCLAEGPAQMLQV